MLLPNTFLPTSFPTMVESIAAQRDHCRFMIAHIISKVKDQGSIPFFPIHQVSSTPNPAQNCASFDRLLSSKLQESDSACRGRSICGNQKHILAQFAAFTLRATLAYSEHYSFFSFSSLHQFSTQVKGKGIEFSQINAQFSPSHSPIQAYHLPTNIPPSPSPSQNSTPPLPGMPHPQTQQPSFGP